MHRPSVNTPPKYVGMRRIYINDVAEYILSILIKADTDKFAKTYANQIH